MSTEAPVAKSDIETWIPLSEMIQTLRLELEAAQVGGSYSDLRFQIEKVDLELKVAVSRTKKGSGGVNFWAINAGGELERTAETTHTITLLLSPISGTSGGRAQVR